jgi:hypothetical protein
MVGLPRIVLLSFVFTFVTRLDIIGLTRASCAVVDCGSATILSFHERLAGAGGVNEADSTSKPLGTCRPVPPFSMSELRVASMWFLLVTAVGFIAIVVPLSPAKSTI